MRILIISNFYPPHYNGGYELGCRDVVEALRARGHDVHILTSTYPAHTPSEQGPVLRWLETNYTWTTEQGAAYAARKVRQEVRCRRRLAAAVRRVRPDLIYVWGMCFIPLSLLFEAQATGLPVCYFIFDDWLKQFEIELFDGTNTPPPSGRRAVYQRGKQMLYALLRGRNTPLLNLRRVQFATQYLKQAALGVGRAVEDAEVILWGIDPAQFPFRAPTDPPRPARRLLFVGQVMAHKGVHTAVQALAAVRAAPAGHDVALTIVGTGKDPDYINSLHTQAEALGVSEWVTFTGKVAREDLPEVYYAHDILLFPSVWAEPFGITLLEAMASGLAVVGTGTGGSGELLRDEENALLFAAEDASLCARQVLRLVEDPMLLEQIRATGRAFVEQNYTFERTVDTIECSLQRSLCGDAETKI